MSAEFAAVGTSSVSVVAICFLVPCAFASNAIADAAGTPSVVSVVAPLTTVTAVCGSDAASMADVADGASVCASVLWGGAGGAGACVSADVAAV